MHYCIIQNKDCFYNNKPGENSGLVSGCPFCKSIQFEKENLLGLELPDGARDWDDVPCPFLGKANMLMTFKVKEIYFPFQKGVLSIKSASGGKEFYDTGSGRQVVDDNSFLVLPDGLSYSSEISSKSEVESFCVFFGKPFILDVFRTLSLPLKKLLESPVETPKKPLNLQPKAYQHDENLKFLFQNFKAAVRIPGVLNAGIFEELMFALLQTIIKKQVDLPQLETRLDRIAAPYRFEILRRLLEAKEYIDENFLREVYLNEIAEVAYFSPYHFLRLFKDAMGKTPRQYIIEKRLEMAKKLLKNSKKSITEISMESGFKSPNYFSRTFRKWQGATPKEFRKIVTQ